MNRDRSDRAYSSWFEESLRFEYFLIGICVAVVGYSVAHIERVRVGLTWISMSIELTGLLLLAVAAAVSLQRVEQMLLVLARTHMSLCSYEEASELERAATSASSAHFRNLTTGETLSSEVASGRAAAARTLGAESEAAAAKAREAAKSRYRPRAWLLVAGLLVLLASRILRAWGC